MTFEKDLGYLGKFFDTLEAHAATLDSQGGARLTAFVAEERERWQSVGGLLTGHSTVPRTADVQVRAAPVAVPREDEPPPVLPTARSPRDEDPGRVPPPHRSMHAVPAPPPPTAVGTRLTVGSLIGRPR